MYFAEIVYLIIIVRLLSNYNIKYICTIYTRLDTCFLSISRFSSLKLYFKIADVAEWQSDDMY
jgi:hypothetical protein